ncbi:MAG: DUF1641 domain-containing protein [Bacteroidota bacterium]|nr:hypothetical protein [Odoribacter sp.]MDP3645099.1 DUF1641 domain-containing protein [Bacteroidota bacterium]
MEEKALEQQVKELNSKMDLLLEYVNEQRLKTNQLEDLLADLQIVGKDVYKTTVEELDKRMVELDPDQLKGLGLRLLRNVGNINNFLETFESAADFLKDASPIANELIIDFTRHMQVMDEKGYFEFFREVGNVFDTIVTNFSADDVRSLADNVVIILNTVKSMTQPQMMNSMHNAISVYSSLDTTNVEPTSIWRMVRELNSPEMKKAMGIMLAFMKNLSTQKFQ